MKIHSHLNPQVFIWAVDLFDMIINNILYYNIARQNTGLSEIFNSRNHIWIDTNLLQYNFKPQMA